MKILPVGGELFHADGQKDRQTWRKLIAAFRNFCEHTPKNLFFLHGSETQTAQAVAYSLYRLHRLLVHPSSTSWRHTEYTLSAHILSVCPTSCPYYIKIFPRTDKRNPVAYCLPCMFDWRFQYTEQCYFLLTFDPLSPHGPSSFGETLLVTEAKLLLFRPVSASPLPWQAPSRCSN